MLHFTDLAELDVLEEKGAFSRGMRPKVAAVRLALGGIAENPCYRFGARGRATGRDFYERWVWNPDCESHR